jgi:Tol biopolymer transport system component
MGKEEPLKLPLRVYRNPRISPDGKKVALDFESGGSQSIWIWDLHRENLTRLTRDAISDAMPLWTPDGQRILFLSSRRGDRINSFCLLAPLAVWYYFHLRAMEFADNRPLA